MGEKKYKVRRVANGKFFGGMEQGGISLAL